MYVKKVNKRGEVQHIDWEKNYVALRKAIGVLDPGRIYYFFSFCAVGMDLNQSAVCNDSFSYNY